MQKIRDRLKEFNSIGHVQLILDTSSLHICGASWVIGVT